MAVSLLAPAFWNGYPLLYFDSVDYVITTFVWSIPIYRTAAYGFFAGLGRLADSLWLVIAVQGVFVAYVLFEARLGLAPLITRLQAATIFLVLVVLTGLPWHVSKIMPDAFTGVAIILTVLLAVGGPTIGRLRQAIMIALLAVAGSAHPTHLAVMAGLILSCWILDCLARRGWPFMRLGVKPALIALALGVMFSGAANWAITGRVFLAPQTAPVLTLAVLFEKGLAQQYLKENCGADVPRRSILCRFRGEHPNDANEFLWHNDKFYRMGGWDLMIVEAPVVLKEIVQQYPITFLRIMAELFLEQIMTIRTGEGIRTMVGYIDSEIEEFYYDEYPRFLYARQQNIPDQTPDAFEPLDSIHVVVGLGGLALAVVVGGIAYRRRDVSLITLIALALLAYMGNAFLCGAISNPSDRYGSRIVWIVLLTGLVGLVGLWQWPGERERPSGAG